MTNTKCSQGTQHCNDFLTLQEVLTGIPPFNLAIDTKDWANPMTKNQEFTKEDLELESRLSKIETVVEAIFEILTNRQKIKDWYTVSELAKILGRSEFTIREWCRLGRVFASKRAAGRGSSKEWIVSNEELDRIQNEGLLPV